MAAALARARIAFDQFRPAFVRNCKRGWEGYKTGSHYVGLPLALGMGDSALRRASRRHGSGSTGLCVRRCVV
jgi:hypothetical protein